MIGRGEERYGLGEKNHPFSISRDVYGKLESCLVWMFVLNKHDICQMKRGKSYYRVLYLNADNIMHESCFECSIDTISLPLLH